MDILFQVGTVGSLLQGVHESEVSVETFSKHGDFGIGTFEATDGELIALDGKVYHIDSQGHAKIAPLEKHIAFAATTFFERTAPIEELQHILNYHDLIQALDARITSKNYIYAIRIDGVFVNMKARSLITQQKPYRPFKDILTDIQTIFEFTKTQGSIIAFRIPEFMSGINFSGYHMHYIDIDRQKGGHLFETGIEQARIQICLIKNFALHLIDNELFAEAPLLAHDQMASALKEAPSSVKKENITNT